MDLKKLVYFSAVAESGSFTKAAAKLHIAQPALSRQIALLEQELGVELLSRMGRHVQLTDAGEVLLRHAHKINNSFELAREELQSRGSQPKGRVILGAPPSLGSVIVPRLFQRLRENGLDIVLKVREGTTAFLERSILDAELDLALLGEEMGNPKIEDQILTREDIVLIGHPELLARIRGGGHKSWGDIPLFVTWQVKVMVDPILRSSRADLPEAMEFDAIHAIKALALEGRGIALGPIALFADDIRQGRVAAAQIEGAELSRPVVMSHSSSRMRTRALDAVLDLLEDEVERLDGEGFFNVPLSVPTESAARKTPLALATH